ncbi:MAG: phage holin family protein [Candidatus Dormibacteria bacterium]
MAERRYPHPMPSEGISAQVADIAADAQRLVRLEIQLAKQEISAFIKTNAVAAGMLAGAALCALFVLYTLVAVIVVGVLWLFLHGGLGRTELALLVILVIWSIAAAILGLLGKSKLVLKMPDMTMQTIKDDVEWAKQQIRPATR